MWSNICSLLSLFLDTEAAVKMWQGWRCSYVKIEPMAERQGRRKRYLAKLSSALQDAMGKLTKKKEPQRHKSSEALIAAAEASAAKNSKSHQDERSFFRHLRSGLGFDAHAEEP